MKSPALESLLRAFEKISLNIFSHSVKSFAINNTISSLSADTKEDETLSSSICRFLVLLLLIVGNSRGKYQSRQRLTKGFEAAPLENLSSFK